MDAWASVGDHSIGTGATLFARNSTKSRLLQGHCLLAEKGQLMLRYRELAWTNSTQEMKKARMSVGKVFSVKVFEEIRGGGSDSTEFCKQLQHVCTGAPNRGLR